MSRKKLTLENFIEKSTKTHDNKYDYSKVELKNYKEKVCIICPTHGEFWQAPNCHNKSGCKKCATETMSLKREIGIENFIKRATEIHKNKYNYSLVNFKKSHDYINIICPVHGIFNQQVSMHLHCGTGCRKCSTIEYGLRQRDTKEKFIEKAIKIHGDKYNYDKVEYEIHYTKVTIICKIHGDFLQVPANHLLGAGCFKCREVGWTKTAWRNSSKDKLVKLYLILCWNEQELFYKIGITNRTLLDRFKQKKLMPYNYRIIDYIFSENSDYIYDIEKQLHKLNKNNKYEPKIKFNGSTECYRELPVIQIH